MSMCTLCPRECSRDRSSKGGFCGEGMQARIARAALHMWEEPCLSGKGGSGTVFFSGCTLRCVFCQNYEISHLGKGAEISDEALSDIFLRLEAQGAENINLVNPTHFTENVIRALELAKHRLSVPIVWNSGGYEKAETIKRLSGYIDIFLPDFKYITPEISLKYSGACDYAERALPAISAMVENVGYPAFSDGGMMKKGVLIRHLILPSHMKESFRVLDAIAENFDTEKLYLSLMCQYFPTHRAFEFPEISRKLTTLEYQNVVKYAQKKGIKNGFCQERSSAETEYVPIFYSEPSEVFPQSENRK